MLHILKEQKENGNLAEYNLDDIILNLGSTFDQIKEFGVIDENGNINIDTDQLLTARENSTNCLYLFTDRL